MGANYPFFATDNDNYVSKLSTWAVYFIFPYSIDYFGKCCRYPREYEKTTKYQKKLYGARYHIIVIGAFYEFSIDNTK